MELAITKQLLARRKWFTNPHNLLIHVLESSIELLSLEDNNFDWSSWRDKEEALSELNSLLAMVQSGDLPERVKISVLFAPTGPIQEVSLSSGWGDIFLKVAEYFDHVESRLWPR